MRRSPDGHSGLENDLREKKEVGDFTIALSYLKKDEHKAYFVVHAHSTKWHSGTGVQRSSAAPGRHKTFLDRLGFKKSSSCNILENNTCQYKILAETSRKDNSIGHSANRQFNKLVENFQEIYDEMLSLDKKLQSAGFELPYDGMELRDLDNEEGESIYGGNKAFSFYKDFKKKISRAETEVFLVDSYVNEDVLELYVENLNEDVDIRILTKQPKNNFEKVAKKLDNERSSKFEVRTHETVHDRLVFIDGQCFVMGQSVKDAGKKPTYMVEVESYKAFKKEFEDLWTSGNKVL